MLRFLPIVVLILAGSVTLAQDDPVFSGPQVGEKLLPFQVKAVIGESAGSEFDPVAHAAGKPLVLVFVHQRTRPAFGLTNLVLEMTADRGESGLQAAAIYLSSDPTESENWMKRVARNFPRGATLGISPDGQEGPGAYGLNRNVSVTVLVGNENEVTANFALVQPSIQADAPKIFKAIVEASGGGPVPDIAKYSGRRMRAADQPARTEDAKLLGLLRKVLNKEASAEDVEKAAQEVENYVSANAAARKDVGARAARVVASDRLTSYGTPKAQEYLRIWARQYGSPATRDDPPKKPAERKKPKNK